MNSETHALQKYEQNGLLFLHPNRCVASYLKLLAQNCDFSTANSLQINLSRKKAGVSHLPFDVTCLDKEVKCNHFNKTRMRDISRSSILFARTVRISELSFFVLSSFGRRKKGVLKQASL